MASSLGLIGDLDDVDLIEDLAQAFDVPLSDDDLKRVRTVGDIYELIESELPESTAGSCATAMCFYRLRRALQPRIKTTLRPQSEIKELETLAVRDLRKIIEGECGLRAPPPYISLLGCIALALTVVLPLSSYWLGLPWWVAIASALFAFGLFQVSPMHLPPGVATFGDLVHEVSSRSIGTLSQQGARLGPNEAWSAFKDVVSGHSSIPKDEITPETIIYSPKVAAS